MNFLDFFKNLSLRFKLLLLLTSVPLLLLSAFLTLVVYTFEMDKIGYVLESSANLSKSLAAQVKSDLSTVLAKTQPFLQDFIDEKRWTEKMQTAFEKESNLWVLAILSGTPNVSDPQSVKVLEKQFGQWDGLIKENPVILQWVSSLAPNSRIIRSLGNQKILIAEKRTDPSQNQEFTYLIVYWAQDLASIFETRKDLKMFLADAEGRVLFGPEPLKNNSLRALLPETFFKNMNRRNGLDGAELVQGKRTEWIVSTASSQFSDLYAYTLIDKRTALAAVVKLLQKSIIFFLLLLCISFMLSLFSSKRLTAALKNLMEATQQITKGNFNISLRIDSRDEVGILSRNFNKMSEEIVRLLQATQENARMENELKTAQTVQSTLFPKNDLNIPEAEISGFYEPASECGGDWWSYSHVGDKVYLWIGDATGHGAPAALVTSAARSAASIIETLRLPPGEALNQLNRSIYDVTNGKVMMTFFLACYDLRTRELRYANASHEPPFLVHKKDQFQFSKRDLELLNNNNSPRLGQKRDSEYAEDTITLEPGDLIFFYTDGLADIQNTEGEKLGDRRFIKVFLDSLSQANSGEVVGNIRQQLSYYRKKATLIDDVTYFVFRVPHRSESSSKSA